MRSDAKNLEAIVRAINYHAATCAFPATGVAMSPFEAERLGWEDIKGVPIVPDSNLETGIFKVLCDGERAPEESVVTSITRDREVVAA